MLFFTGLNRRKLREEGGGRGGYGSAPFRARTFIKFSP